jgi:hypothetical protein
MSIRASRDRFADCPFGDKAIRRWRLPSRARQRERRGYDLRPQYRESDLPTTAHVAVTTIEDAYAPAGRVDKAGILHVEAELEPVRHRDGSLSEGAPAWRPPERPRSTVFVNLREDPIGRMHARRQVDEAQYSAARAYQRLYDCPTIGNLSPADPSRIRVDGGKAPDPISAARMAAATRLRSVEGDSERLVRPCRLELDALRAHRRQIGRQGRTRFRSELEPRVAQLGLVIPEMFGRARPSTWLRQ